MITLENLFLAWQEFKKGKTKRKDVQEFEFNLEDNLFQLYQDLKTKSYCHSNYKSFYIQDPKLRHIHKAAVRDRIVHHLNNFLKNKLKISLHPDKIIVRKFRQGIDFLGYVSLPYYRVLRTKTKRRMLRRINQKNLSSYLGVLSHCSGYKLKEKLINYVN